MRNLLDITDFTASELKELLSLADDIMANKEKYADKCKGKKLATLFFEPSTRTRLSFEAAMLELGGSVLGFSSAASSSSTKGESIKDTVSVVSNYADIIAMRSPVEGAPFAAVSVAAVPLINAGDGGHCHPTQTLADLLTIHKEIGRFGNITVGVCGDLKYGRTVHSLLSAMARYENVRFVLISPEELALPKYAADKLKNCGAKVVVTDSLENYMSELDVLYMTRIQRERFSDTNEYERLKDSYVLTPEKLLSAKPTMRVLHPLPRVNEISVAVDSDLRAAYFRQTYYGKIMRMALIVKLLSSLDEPDTVRNSGEISGYHCVNEKCATKSERELPEYSYLNADGAPCCVYCEHETVKD